jgi:hypothetical protein
LINSTKTTRDGIHERNLRLPSLVPGSGARPGKSASVSSPSPRTPPGSLRATTAGLAAECDWDMIETCRLDTARIVEASLHLHQSNMWFQSPQISQCPFCIDDEPKIFQERTKPLNRVNKLWDQPPLTHHPGCSPSAQAPSLSSSDNPIM